jgi:hypothetical protein
MCDLIGLQFHPSTYAPICQEVLCDLEQILGVAFKKILYYDIFCFEFVTIEVELWITA